MATSLLSPAQMNQALLSQTKLNAIFKQVSTVAQEAIDWFDTARRVDQLASTKFTFTIEHFFDARVIYQDGKPTSSFGWYRKDTNRFEVSRGGGPAYDQALNALGTGSMLESDPTFPRQPTASLPVAQIITVNELTEKLFSELKRPVPQKVIKIDLCVQLFDLEENCITTKNWVVPLETSN